MMMTMLMWKESQGSSSVDKGLSSVHKATGLILGTKEKNRKKRDFPISLAKTGKNKKEHIPITLAFIDIFGHQ